MFNFSPRLIATYRRRASFSATKIELVELSGVVQQRVEQRIDTGER
jgi:hypothetical protein